MATQDKIVSGGKSVVSVPAPRFNEATFEIVGTAPLVIHRMSAKLKAQFKQKMEAGKAGGNKKVREAQDTDQIYNDARYVAKQGWDGFHAAAVRNAMISACRLVGLKMTLAKMSIFVLADGVDAKEPQIPLIKICGTKPTKQEDIARVETGQPYLCVRPAYHDWSAKVRIRWDEDQHTKQDITNLLMRVGQQVGFGEGRPDSKNSAGMGWGTFELKQRGA